MMFPPDPPEDTEAELLCEAFCLEEGLEIIWSAYGDMVPDEDGFAFEPYDNDEATCPWCNTIREYDVLSTETV